MQQPIELILTKQWAENLAFPIWVMDGKGNLIYFNEQAEKLLGLSYETHGEITAKTLNESFKYLGEDGLPIPVTSLPINVALNEHHPAHLKFKILTLKGTWKWIESTSFPILGQGSRHLGAISIFWESKTS